MRKRRGSRGCVGTPKRYCPPAGPGGSAPLARSALASKELATTGLSIKTSGFRDIHASKGSNRA
jgi:hypothetical protein